MTKRLFALLLSVVMLFALAIPAAAAFDDSAPNDPSNNPQQVEERDVDVNNLPDKIGSLIKEDTLPETGAMTSTALIAAVGSMTVLAAGLFVCTKKHSR